MTTALLLIVFVAIVGNLARDGLWSNLITLFCATTAAILATNYFEFVADLLTGLIPQAVHFWDVLALGIVFVIAFILLRTLANKISRFRVRFHPPVDNFGGVAVAALTGWTAICFVAFSLHLAPLGRTGLRNSFDPEARMFFGLAPDRIWLAYMQKLTNGGGLGRNVVNEDGEVTSMFDPKSDLMLKYASRRDWLDKKATNFVD